MVGEEGMRGRDTEREGDAMRGRTGGDAVAGRGAEGDEGIFFFNSSTVGASYASREVTPYEEGERGVQGTIKREAIVPVPSLFANFLAMGCLGHLS